nr:MAG TPA: hypothetical protein [Caudoviricetes sp.]
MYYSIQRNFVYYSRISQCRRVASILRLLV